MKNILGVLLCAVLMGSCGLLTERESVWNGNEEKSANTKTIHCDQSVTYGDVAICLPAINGMVECYDNAKVKARADAFNPDMNVILGYYLNDATYKRVDNLDEVVLDDYFQIYAAKSLQGVKVSTTELDKMGETISDKYIKENWDDLNAKVNEEFEFLSVAKPILLDSYTPNPDARTYVLLIKYEEEKGGEDFHILVTTMNVVRIQDRMIFMAYYKAFKSEETITKAKEKNDAIVEALVKANS